MSEPKRYGHKAIIYPKSDDDTYITIPVEQEDGQWVSYEDYARLKAEVERLTAFTTRTIIPNVQLQAQVERLKKYNEEAMAHIAKEERKSRERLDMVQAEVEKWRNLTRYWSDKYKDENASLHRSRKATKQAYAEVERLTKAGDALVSLLEDEEYDMESIHQVEAWNAAKEGKQP